MSIDLRWKVPNTSQLWLKWDRAICKGEGTVELKNAEFFGPVLNDCLKLENSGFLNLDLTKHFILIIPAPYIVRFSWDGVISQDQTSIKLAAARFEDLSLGHLNKLKKSDLILLDCSGHTTEDESRGHYKAVFEAMVYDETKNPYDFSK